MLTFISWYLTISYLVGFVLFTYECLRMVKEDNYHLFGFGIVLLFLSPLTAWHGALHYVAVWWHRLNGTPFKPWI
jgi:hypothetical protein